MKSKMRLTKKLKINIMKITKRLMIKKRYKPHCLYNIKMNFLSQIFKKEYLKKYKNMLASIYLFKAV